MGERNKSLEYSTKAYKSFPESVNVISHLSDCYYTLQQYSKAIEFGEKAIELVKHESYYLNVSKAYMRNGNLEKAIEYCQIAISLNENCASSHCFLGTCFRLTRQYQEALKELRKSVEMKADYSIAHYNLAQIYHINLIDVEKAYYHFKRVVEIGKDQVARSHYCLAVLLLSKEPAKISEIIFHIQQAIEIEPDNKEYQKFYSDIKEMMNISDFDIVVVQK